MKAECDSDKPCKCVEMLNLQNYSSGGDLEWHNVESVCGLSQWLGSVSAKH